MKLTPTDRRLLIMLDAEGDLTPADLAELMGLADHVWIGKKLRRLLQHEFVRVAKWLRNSDGPAIPIYSITTGASAKRPRALGYSAWCKRYRARLAERGGRQYLLARQSLIALSRGLGK